MIPSKFDPVRAIREEIVGINDVIKTYNSWASRAEEKLAMAEVELNACRKMASFAAAERDRKILVLEELERNSAD